MRFFALIVLVLGLATPAYAQFAIPGAETALTISLSPSNPAPRSSVQLTLQSALYDLDTSAITWTVNGKTAAQGIGTKTLNITTGSLGSSLSVLAEVSADNGAASAQTSVSPTSIDLLWESDSYVPPFYRGRALPSAGSSVTLVAIPHFIRDSGSAVPSDQIVYTWKKDGEAIVGASGRGKASARIAGPMLYGNDLVSVEAVSVDGTLSGETSVRIADIEPQLMLYEMHPLFGTLYHRALGAATLIPETEMSFAAVPYFAAVSTPDDSKLAYVWRVNELTVAPDTARPSKLTINAEKSSGIAFVSLALTHATNYYLDLNNAWQITFTKSGSPSGTNDPFRQ